MVAMEVQSSLDESSEIFITRLCKMLCRSHDDQRAGRFLKQRVSMALQIGNAGCILGTVSDRNSFEEIYYISFVFLKPIYYWSLLRMCFYLSTGVVAGMSILLVVFLLLVDWDSGWHGVPYFRCRPRMCIFSPNMIIHMALD